MKTFGLALLILACLVTSGFAAGWLPDTGATTLTAKYWPTYACTWGACVGSVASMTVEGVTVTGNTICIQGVCKPISDLFCRIGFFTGKVRLSPCKDDAPATLKVGDTMVTFQFADWAAAGPMCGWNLTPILPQCK